MRINKIILNTIEYFILIWYYSIAQYMAEE